LERTSISACSQSINVYNKKIFKPLLNAVCSVPG
jgi:hypothetical protein